MLGWEALSAFWLGLLILPVAVFYFLRMRFRRQPVSSVYLWSRLQRTNHGGRAFRQRTLGLLCLELAAVLAAVAVLAHPQWVVSQAHQPGQLFLIDVSASMSALEADRDGRVRTKTRIDLAREAVAAEIEKLPDRSPGLIVQCDTRAVPLGKPDFNRKQLLEELRRVRAGAAGFDEERVCADLAVWLSRQNRPYRAVLITDGGIDLGGAKLSALFSGAIRLRQVGTRRDNLGLAGLRILPGAKPVVQVINSRTVPQDALLRLDFEGKAIARLRIKAPPGISGHSFAKAVAYRPGGYRVSLLNHRDHFPADDQSFFAVNQPRRLRVLRIGPANPFFEAVLDHPLIQGATWPGFVREKYRDADWDLVIVERVPVPPGLKTNLLCLGVIPPEAPLRRGAPVQGGPLVADATRPDSRFVDWGDATIGQGFRLRTDQRVEVLATVNRQPIAAAWRERDGLRIVWGTDLFGSNLGLSAGFPVFMQNLWQRIDPSWNNPLADNLTIGAPENDGRGEPGTGEAGSNAIRTRGPEPVNTPGLYYWTRGERSGVLAANLPSGESDLAPRQLTADFRGNRLTAVTVLERVSLTQIGLVLLLACLACEWFLWRGLRAAPGKKSLGR
jgi:hypothetical protein